MVSFHRAGRHVDQCPSQHTTQLPTLIVHLSGAKLAIVPQPISGGYADRVTLRCNEARAFHGTTLNLLYYSHFPVP